MKDIAQKLLIARSINNNVKFQIPTIVIKWDSHTEWSTKSTFALKQEKRVSKIINFGILLITLYQANQIGLISRDWEDVKINDAVLQ